MKNALLIVTVLITAIMSTACINNFAVQELNNKAQEYINKGDYESAIGRLEASIDIDPTIYETHYNLGIAALSAEKFDKAIDAFKVAADLKPSNADIYYSLAVAQYNYAEKLIEDNNDAEENKLDEEQLSKQTFTLYKDAIQSLKNCLGCKDISEETKSAAEAQLNSILLKIKDNSEDSKEG